MWNVEQPGFIGKVDLPSAFELVDFTPAALKAFSKYVHEVYSHDVPYVVINISSFGGSVGCMSGFMSIIETYRKKGLVFVGSVTGYAMSAGAVIFLFCNEGFRFMGPSARLMFHNTYSGHDYDRISAIKSYADFEHKQDEEINQKLSLHLKKGKNWLRAQMKKQTNNDWHLTAKESEDLGLCKVGIPTFELRIGAEFQIKY